MKKAANLQPVPNPLRITFDSNVWQPTVLPDDFPNDAAIASFRVIHDAIKAGSAAGYLSETIFTLEGIKKSGRKKYFSEHRAKVETTVNPQPDGSIHMRLVIGPDPTKGVKNNPYLDKYLEAARALKFKVLRCNRVAGVKNVDIPESDFAPNDTVPFDQQNEKTGACGREIQARGAGIAQLQILGATYAGGRHWTEGIGAAPGSEDNKVVRAVAEWADGDSVAAHVGHQNDYFCTRDMASGAGSKSIFSESNRLWLVQTYGLKFVLPEELASLLTAPKAAS